MTGLLVSLALGIIIESVISMCFGTDAKSIAAGVLPTVSFLGLRITVSGIVTLACGLILFLAAIIAIRRMPWGRKLLGVAENDYLISSFGIKPSSLRRQTFLIASVLAAVVGVATTVNTALVPTAGFPLVITAFMALLIGGLTSIKGIVISSYLLTLIPELLISFSSGSWNLNSSWKMLIVFAISATVLAWRPDGIFANKLRVN
jgi:branched-chain amino acid transport system permease protein